MGSLIQMGVNAATGYRKGQLQNAMNDAEKTVGMAQLDANRITAEANAAAQDALKGANNTLMAARVALSNFNRSADNQAKLDTAGNRYNASVVTEARLGDARANNSLEASLRSAEQQGAITAAAAANGVGGTSANMLHSALAAAVARTQVRNDEKFKQTTYDMLVQRAGLMAGAIKSLDEGQTFAPLDVTKTIVPTVVAPMWAADYDLPPIAQAALAMGTGGINWNFGNTGYQSQGNHLFGGDNTAWSNAQSNPSEGYSLSFGFDTKSYSGTSYSSFGAGDSRTSSMFGAGSGGSDYGGGAQAFDL
ncbi:hypothetical protein ACPPTR_13600 [Ralstonia pseudosolanacearum]|uniref:hypothetical protein n=1 Tax=Ralstonia pseudosolanacearum TaxID=1310165 RepID=UPI0008F90AEC|nr:hypothetical protein [Ralstonia pseudosolanacearum]MCD9228597.1 hypothetical protein [Ralstonia pseudosolanacearum]MCK4161704.1 hypothetical protein [Ralstonia pseudosolanacearum]OIN77226.1 hypothetical protein BL248_02575 [Ralstonia solanacearum]